MLPHWSQNDCLVNGARMHYYRTNDGHASGKPALVLAHGFSDNGLCWEPAAADLEGEYDVLMPEARGHGLSERVQRNAKFDMASDLAGFISALGLEQAIVGGHSMGAATAFQTGARFPRLVRALILEDPPWSAAHTSGPRPLGEDSPLGKWMLSLQNQTLEQVMAQCRVDHPGWPEMIVRRWCEGKKQLDPNFLASDNLTFGNWQDMIQSIACPTLLVTADPDQGGIVTPELAQQVMERNTHFRLVHIPRVGHHVRFGNHAEYMQALRSFLQNVERA
ncbi:MAG TPA: alpha/beta hydrolase [Anaerolineae bacterium]